MYLCMYTRTHTHTHAHKLTCVRIERVRLEKKMCSFRAGAYLRIHWKIKFCEITRRITPHSHPIISPLLLFQPVRTALCSHHASTTPMCFQTHTHTRTHNSSITHECATWMCQQYALSSAHSLFQPCDNVSPPNRLILFLVRSLSISHTPLSRSCTFSCS